MRRGFFGDEDVGAGVLFVEGENLLFVVAALGVDFPVVGFVGGLETQRRHDKALKCEQGRLAPFTAKI